MSTLIRILSTFLLVACLLLHAESGRLQAESLRIADFGKDNIAQAMQETRALLDAAQPESSAPQQPRSIVS